MELVTALETTVMVRTLCSTDQQRKRHEQTYTKAKEADKIKTNLQKWLDWIENADRWWSRESREALDKAQDLAITETYAFQQLEREVISGSASLAAEVSVACECIELLRDAGAEMVSLVMDEMTALDGVMAALEE